MTHTDTHARSKIQTVRALSLFLGLNQARFGSDMDDISKSLP